MINMRKSNNLNEIMKTLAIILLIMLIFAYGTIYFSKNDNGITATQTKEIVAIQREELKVDVDIQNLEDQIYYDINLERLKNGRFLYARNPALDKIAKEYSKYLLTLPVEDYAHETAEGKKLGDRLLENNVFYLCSSENLNYLESLKKYKNVRAISKDVVNAWLESPSHRTSLLNKERAYSDVGVGVACSDKGRCYFTVEIVCLKSAGSIELKKDYLTFVKLYDESLPFDYNVNADIEVKSTDRINVYVLNAQDDFYKILENKDVIKIREYNNKRDVRDNLVVGKGTILVLDAQPAKEDVEIEYSIRYSRAFN